MTPEKETTMSSEDCLEFILEDDTPAAYATAPPSGVLSVHIKLVRDIDEGHISVTEPELYVRIKVGSFVKSTQPVIVEKDAKVVLDDLKHFSLQIPRKRSDPSNEVRFDLIVVESPHVHRIVGHKDMHLYDIIKNLFVAGSYDFQYRHKTVAMVDLEMCFAYGIFGYGCCHQLQNRQKKISDVVGHSLLLRVESPESRCQPNAGHVMTAMPVGHPEFINFQAKAEIGPSSGDIRAEVSTKSLFSGLELQEPIVLTRTMRKRLHKIQTDYAQQESRMQRKRFLERLVLRHIHDHHAIETGEDKTREEDAAGPSGAGPTPAENVAVDAETYGTDSDYAESATDLSELMSSMLMNAPGLVSRAPARWMPQPSLFSIGEETTDVDSTASDIEPAPSMQSSENETKKSSFHEPAKEERRRSTLAELPGLLVRSFANRLSAWRTSRSRPSQQITPVVVTDDGQVSQSMSRGAISMSRFRSRLTTQD
ncbi:C2 calcium-dependent domain-containing protein 6-like isoform X2 [Acanthaster planci]|uniref:C2 calcium-dependent domain-containing protein 6-like isoform X2 n=1 Tax=Acanthaster planci TaxID=133434 RepID=A0A8B7YGA6_ACAPL|nr:C2 calcium-dependent domain-containing protein 6-like isoform X2 [Acanthaster planci]